MRETFNISERIHRMREVQYASVFAQNFFRFKLTHSNADISEIEVYFLLIRQYHIRVRNLLGKLFYQTKVKNYAVYAA